MASFTAILEVKGNRFPLLAYDLSIHQETDSLGRPASPTLGGTIDCVLSAPGSDQPFLLQWMFSPTMQEDGKIILLQESPRATLKTISFFNAYCTGLQTNFVPGDSKGGSLQMHIRISPQRIAVGAIIHDNNWPLVSHGAGETFAKATPPAPNGKAAKEEEPSAFMEGLHSVLDVVGMIPVIGEVADLANAAIYVSEGRYGEAALSAASAIPLAGNAIGAAKIIRRGAKLVDKVRDLKVVQKLRKAIPDKFVKKLDDVDFAGKGGCDGRGHPVDVATGLMYTTAVDFILPGPIPLSWERNWYSASDYQGPLGYGWHSVYDMALALDASTNVAVLRLADGRQVAFEPPTTPGQPVLQVEMQLTMYRPLPKSGTADDLQLAPWIVWDKASQVYYTFAPPTMDGSYQPLHTIENNEGRFIGFQYSPDLRLQRVTDSAGRQLVFSHTAQGRIEAITVLAGEEPTTLIRYKYDESGDLVSSTNAEGHSIRYRYEQHRMVQETDPLGHSFFFEFEAVPVGDKPLRCVHTWGDGGMFDTRLAYIDEQTTDVTDSYGHPDRYLHQQGRVISKTNALGHTELRYFDESQQLIARTDELGRTTRYRYDEQGNLISTQYADGSRQEIDYDQDDRPVAFTDRRGSTWRYQYDDNGRLTNQTDALEANTAYAYDAEGQLVTITNALGQQTNLRYTKQGQLAHIVTPDEQIRSRTYDALGNLITLTDPTGSLQQRRYNGLGQLIEITEADGLTYKATYDAAGNPIRVQQGDESVDMQYNSIHKLMQQRQADKATQFQYDLEGRLTGVVNEAGLLYRYGLDSTGQVVEEEGYDRLLRRYKRDAAGQVMRVMRPGNRTTDYSYTSMGQVATVYHSDGTREAYDYDETGDLIKAQTNDTTLRFERDALGRVVREEQADQWVNHSYDALGQRIRLTSSLGADVALERDALGNLTELHTQSWHMQSSYDSRGLEIQRTMSGGLQAIWQHDAAGRPVQQRVSHGVQQRVRTYHWQTGDVLAQIDDSVSGTSLYEHDLFGTLTRARYADGLEEVRLPDVTGNLFESSSKTDRQYGPSGQLLSSIDATYAYDEEGNLISKVTGKREEWRYDWADNGTLSQVTRPDGAVVTFTYDALGRRTGKHYKGKTTHWLWDNAKLLHEWQTLSLDGHNTNDIITWLFDEDSYIPIAKLQGNCRQSILTDHLGTPLEMVDQGGHRTWSAQTTAYGRVRMEVGSRAECPFRFQGQYEDVETGLYYNRFRYYAPQESLYISQDPIRLEGGNPTLYGYVYDVNAEVDPFGLATLFKLGTYGSLNGPAHIGDGLQAHELIRHEFLVQQGKATKDLRLSGNPSIALDNAHHTRTGGAHWHEARIRASQGLGRNEFPASLKRELDITQGGLRKAGVPASRARKLRKQSEQFYKNLLKNTSCPPGAGTP